jgi:hypothetical protein
VRFCSPYLKYKNGESTVLFIDTLQACLNSFLLVDASQGLEPAGGLDHMSVNASSLAFVADFSVHVCVVVGALRWRLIWQRHGAITQPSGSTHPGCRSVNRGINPQIDPHDNGSF